MKAAQIIEWGQPLQLKELPVPVAGEGEVLVQVKAASINGIDWKIAAGYLRQMLTVPMTPGTDFAGQVVSIGSGVTDYKPGDKVYGFIPMRGGTFAEYAVVKTTELAYKPRTLDYIQAAAVPLVAATAWQALDLAHLQAGERVLVRGAGGGVGSYVVQFAKARGAYVIGVAGPDKQSFMRELEADQLVNYQVQPFEEAVQKVEVVIDTVGGEILDRSLAVLKSGGRLVTLGRPSEKGYERQDVQIHTLFAQPNSAQLSQIASLIDSGKVRVAIQRVFALEEVETALKLVQVSQQPGKVVLKIV